MSEFLKFLNSEEKIIQPVSEAQKKLASAFVDVNKKIEFPPIALSIGSHSVGSNTYPTAFATYGNFSCLMAPSKARKSFFKSLLVASYIGGNVNQFTSSIKTHRSNNGYILDFDTEQSRFHAQNVFRRVIPMTGSNPDFYRPFALREYSVSERIEIIETAIYSSEYSDNIEFIIIDGIADLVKDVNDIKESTFIIEKLMRWTSDKKCHILNVIHTNPGTNKPKGHLGTFIMQKAETVARLTLLDERQTSIEFPFTRNYPIGNMTMEINSDGLPFIVGEQLAIIEEKSVIQPNMNFESDPF